MEFWAELWELAKTAGPFGTAFATMMWWLERKERVESQKGHLALLERTLTAISTATKAVERFGELLTRRRT